jgi:hypothetical protein
VNPNLPGGYGNGYYTSELSQTISAAFKSFPPDRYAELYKRYLGRSNLGLAQQQIRTPVYPCKMLGPENRMTGKSHEEK